MNSYKICQGLENASRHPSVAKQKDSDFAKYFCSFQVNVGDLLEVFSNGRFPATRHRVVIPEAEIRRKKPRQSFVFFIHPDDVTWVEPINGEKPTDKKYEGVNARQHLLNQFAQTYK